MAARAIWKGVVRFEDVAVPVKLYSAVQDRRVHFRMLHRKDKAPVKQMMVNPESNKPVAYQDTLRAYRTEDGRMVLLDPEELADLEPARSRDIEILHFLPQKAIDHRWYDRPYYLGPDGDAGAYFALSQALEDSHHEGLAQWVMRNKRYLGALRLYEGYPMLMSLRHAGQVVSASQLQAPTGRALEKKELGMAQQLISMLEATFDPQEYQDEYQARLRELIEKKRKGGRIQTAPPPEPKETDDLSQALEASLKKVNHG